MNNQKIARLYKSNQVVEAVFDLLEERANNSNVTKIDQVLRLLKRNGATVSRRTVIAAFRALEEVGCGVYVRGSHGHPSRFLWEVKTKLLAGIAAGKIQRETDIAIDDSDGEEEVGSNDEDDDENDEAIETGIFHNYVLRPQLTVEFYLPEDLTEDEAYRLSRFVDTLSFADSNQDEDDDDHLLDNDETIDHEYKLRRYDDPIFFSLPADLTEKEAGRLSTFIGSLSFDR